MKSMIYGAAFVVIMLCAAGAGGVMLSQPGVDKIGFVIGAATMIAVLFVGALVAIWKYA